MEANVDWHVFNSCNVVKEKSNQGFVNFYGIQSPQDRQLGAILYMASEIFGKGNYYITDLAKCAFKNNGSRVEKTRDQR